MNRTSSSPFPSLPNLILCIEMHLHANTLSLQDSRSTLFTSIQRLDIIHRRALPLIGLKSFGRQDSPHITLYIYNVRVKLLYLSIHSLRYSLVVVVV